MDKQKRIIEKAKEMFLTYGYSNTSMNSLSKQLGMSKKTVYNYFTSKESLLDQIINDFFDRITKESNAISGNEKLDLLAKIQGIYTMAGSVLSTISPHFLDDISTNAPDIWRKIQAKKQDIVFKSFYKLLKEGQKQGYIKKNINTSLAVLIYTSAIETIIIPSFTKQIPNEMLKELPYSTEGIFEGLMEIIFEGIISEK